MIFTLADLRTQIQIDLDYIASNGSIATGDSIVSPSEINTHIRRAILDAVNLVNKLYEDYFLVPESALSIVDGTQSYSTPTDLYINKIRRIIYNDGSRNYPIDRIIDINEIPNIQSNDDLRYMLVHELGAGYKIRFYPTPNFTSSSIVKIWYIRKPKELILDTDILDVPEEVSNYIIANAKFRCLQKEIGNPIRAEYKVERDEQRQALMVILSNRIPDDKTDLRPDYSFYNESEA